MESLWAFLFGCVIGAAAGIWFCYGLMKAIGYKKVRHDGVADR